MVAISLFYILTTSLGNETLISSRLTAVYAALEDHTEVSESAKAALRDTLTANTAYSQPNAVQEQ